MAQSVRVFPDNLSFISLEAREEIYGLRVKSSIKDSPRGYRQFLGTVPTSRTGGSCRIVKNAKYHTYHSIRTVRALSRLLRTFTYIQKVHQANLHEGNAAY